MMARESGSTEREFAAALSNRFDQIVELLPEQGARGAAVLIPGRLVEPILEERTDIALQETTPRCN